MSMSLTSSSAEFYGIFDKKASIYKKYDKENIPIEIGGGNLVQVTQELGEQITIKIFSLQAGTLLWSTDLFTTTRSNIIPVSMKLWEILLAVKHPDMRTRIMKNGKSFTNFLLGIRIGSKITIRGTVFNRNYDIPCIVRYTGHVPEIGPGVFYGFEFCDVNEKVPPRNNLPYRYCNCDNSRGFIRAADCFLSPPPHEIPKNRVVGMREATRSYQNVGESQKEVIHNVQPSTSSALPQGPNKRKPKPPKTNESRKDPVDPEKDSEIEDLRKKIEILELQLKEKALKDKLNSEDATTPSEAKVYQRKKPKRNNKQYARTNKPEEIRSYDVAAASIIKGEASGGQLRNPNSKTHSLSQSDLSYFEQISSAAPPKLKPINIFDTKERHPVPHDSTGYRELIDFLN